MATSSLERDIDRQQRIIDRSVQAAVWQAGIVQGMRNASYPDSAIANGSYDEDGEFTKWQQIGDEVGAFPLKPTM